MNSVSCSLAIIGRPRRLTTAAAVIIAMLNVETTAFFARAIGVSCLLGVQWWNVGPASERGTGLS